MSDVIFRKRMVLNCDNFDIVVSYSAKRLFVSVNWTTEVEGKDWKQFVFLGVPPLYFGFMLSSVHSTITVWTGIVRHCHRGDKSGFNSFQNHAFDVFLKRDTG